MKNLLFLFIFFVVINCSNNNTVFWCGDQPCINKKERESYFKRTMIVEVKELEEMNKKDKSEIEKITQQARIDEKKRIKDEKKISKNIKLQEKHKIKREKELAKQRKKSEKKRIKEEKELAKIHEKNEKKRLKEQKKLIKKVKKTPENSKISTKQKIITSKDSQNLSIALNDFDDIKKRIVEKNILRPYPDINDIPN